MVEYPNRLYYYGHQQTNIMNLKVTSLEVASNVTLTENTFYGPYDVSDSNKVVVFGNIGNNTVDMNVYFGFMNDTDANYRSDAVYTKSLSPNSNFHFIFDCPAKYIWLNFTGDDVDNSYIYIQGKP